jgi:gliding motility-associated-like protein
VYQLYAQTAGCVVAYPFEITGNALQDSTVYAPNVFQPGTGGENGTFRLYLPANVFQQIRWFQVYDRWGSIVFEQKNSLPNTGTGWDGTYKGQLLAPGLYVWQALLEYPGGETYLIKGDVTLLR